MNSCIGYNRHRRDYEITIAGVTVAYANDYIAADAAMVEIRVQVEAARRELAALIAQAPKPKAKAKRAARRVVACSCPGCAPFLSIALDGVYACYAVRPVEWHVYFKRSYVGIYPSRELAEAAHRELRYAELTA